MNRAAASAALPVRLAERSMIWRAAIILAGTMVLAATAWAQVPMYPVPISLQSFGVLFIAAVAGPRLSVEIVLAYLAEAAVGLPVLAGGAAGAAHFVGPTAGYLAGFIAAAALAGTMTRRGAHDAGGLMRLAAAGLVGHAVILAMGWTWLALLIGPAAAFTGGVAPFLIGALFKTGLIVTAVCLAEPLLRRDA